MSQSVNGKKNYKIFDRRIETPVKNTSFFSFSFINNKHFKKAKKKKN